ncbi:unnamed protein product [Diplocarpon coronariae]|uniref:Uncharacterized protein n=1 Tax=Diplocarpon coronariae TaxID=2795749 RepID=A0A218YZL3_9HELO|nr:hypothetical protein B2J93_5489 [Marssonina coronariae]
MWLAALPLTLDSWEFVLLGLGNLLSPGSRAGYHTVNACLIRWESDNLNAKNELDAQHDTIRPAGNLVLEESGFKTSTTLWIMVAHAPRSRRAGAQPVKAEGETECFLVGGGEGDIGGAEEQRQR